MVLEGDDVDWTNHKYFLIRTVITVLGVPTALFTCGYLVDKGHISLLGLPSGLLGTSPDRLVYLGGNWLVGTIVIIVRHWLSVTAIVAFTLVIWALGRISLIRRYRGLLLLLGLFAASAILFVVTYRIVQYRTTAFHDSHFTTTKLTFQSDPECENQRIKLYRALSCANALLVFCLPILWRARIVTPNLFARAALLATITIATATSAAALLAWPMCYGRLILGYSRPSITVADEADVSLVLNPYQPTWTICRFSENGGAVELSKFEPNYDHGFRIIGEENIFNFLRRSRIQSTIRSLTLADIAQLITDSTNIKITEFLEGSHLASLKTAPNGLCSFLYDCDNQTENRLQLPAETTCVLVSRRRALVFAIVRSRLRVFDMGDNYSLTERKDALNWPGEVVSLLGFDAQNPSRLFMLLNNNLVWSFDVDRADARLVGSITEESERVLVSQHIRNDGSLAFALSREAGNFRLQHRRGQFAKLLVERTGPECTIRVPRWSDDGSWLVYLATPSD